MAVCRSLLCACLLALSVTACTGGPLREDVIAQARPGGPVAFDVVKLDRAVLNTLAAERPPEFQERFKRYLPPPEIKIAVGDTVSIVIWESGADGLFGNSITELSFPAGAAARLKVERPQPLGGVPGTPGGLAAAPEVVGRLFGGGGLAGAPPAARSRRLQQLLDVGTESGRPGTRIPDQQVGSDGAISIPYAGRIKVAGLTPEQVEHKIDKLLAPKALDPQALVAVSRSAENSVSVAGDAVAGARVQLSPGGDRLLQVIAAAGGAKTPVRDTLVRLSRGGATATVPLGTLVADPKQDIFAEPGDVLTLSQRPQTYSVFGATGQNTAITFMQDHLSLAEALAKAGGLLDERADPRAVFLFRYEPVKVVRALGQPIATGARGGYSPVAYRLDLRQAGSYLLAREFPVHDKDVIFVANAKTVPINYFFQVLSQLTGPVVTGFVTCQTAHC